jgi:plastocyanin
VAPSVAPSIAPSTAAPSTAASIAPAAAGNAVSIANFAFAPASLTVAVGTTVTWTNSDTAGHTVTADDGSFKSNTLGTGATFAQTFAKAGTFAYHCSIHKSMTGTITVH